MTNKWDTYECVYSFHAFMDQCDTDDDVMMM